MFGATQVAGKAQAGRACDVGCHCAVYGVATGAAYQVSSPTTHIPGLAHEDEDPITRLGSRRSPRTRRADPPRPRAERFRPGRQDIGRDFPRCAARRKGDNAGGREHHCSHRIRIRPPAMEETPSQDPAVSSKASRRSHCAGGVRPRDRARGGDAGSRRRPVFTRGSRPVRGTGGARQSVAASVVVQFSGIDSHVMGESRQIRRSLMISLAISWRAALSNAPFAVCSVSAQSPHWPERAADGEARETSPRESDRRTLRRLRPRRRVHPRLLPRRRDPAQHPVREHRRVPPRHAHRGRPRATSPPTTARCSRTGSRSAGPATPARKCSSGTARAS